MASARNRLLGVLLVSGLASVGLAACSSDDGSSGTPGSGGTGGTGSGGVTGSGGSVSTGGTGTGGKTASTGGQVGSGGAAGTTSSGSGGKATGGTAGDGPGGAAGGGEAGTSTAQGGGPGGAAGRTGIGGRTGGPGGAAGRTGIGGQTGGPGGAAGGTGIGGQTGGGQGGAAGSTGGGGSTGGCVKGGFKGSDLVIFGESFYDWNPPHIKNRLEELARKAGSLGASDSYRQYAVAGQNMSYIANTEYNNAVKAGKFTKVVMDGGGIDCMTSSCPTCPDTFKGMLDKLVTQGVDQLIYTRYPEPGNPPGSNASLKGNLDALMPKMETVCKGYTGLKCYWVDLRPVWPAEKDKYTTDGLHPTKTGGDVVGDAIWAEMVKQCMAQ